MNITKKRFHKVKRRIELGHDKPGDRHLYRELSIKLNYTLYELKTGKVQAKNG